LSQFANLFENLSSSEWLLYISEWQYCNNTLSNIRVTTKVAVNSLLSDNKDLQDRGSAILHNLACKEVKSVVGIPAAHPRNLKNFVLWLLVLHKLSDRINTDRSTSLSCFLCLLTGQYVFAENEQQAKPAQDFATGQCFKGSRQSSLFLNVFLTYIRHC
jgi:hypothetical protein